MPQVMVVISRKLIYVRVICIGTISGLIHKQGYAFALQCVCPWLLQDKNALIDLWPTRRNFPLKIKNYLPLCPNSNMRNMQDQLWCGLSHYCDIKKKDETAYWYIYKITYSNRGEIENWKYSILLVSTWRLFMKCLMVQIKFSANFLRWLTKSAVVLVSLKRVFSLQSNPQRQNRLHSE